MTSKETTSKENRMTSVCMTLNNYTQAQYDNIISQSSNVRYLIVAKEVGEQNQTPHLQMYCEFNSGGGKTQSAIKKFFNIKELHIEQRKGTPKQASDYCQYADYPACQIENTEFSIFGEITQQGTRTDWAIAIADLEQGVSVKDVIKSQPALGHSYRALVGLRHEFQQSIHREINVIVYYGDSGTGKSRAAFLADANLFNKPDGNWWDGYSSQETILLDDFYGDIPYSQLLKVLDRYPYSVPIKGGFAGARWSTVYITSNKPPKRWYHHGLTPALKRRLTTVYKLVAVGVTTDWYQHNLETNKLIYFKTVDIKTNLPCNRVTNVIDSVMPTSIYDSDTG